MQFVILHWEDPITRFLKGLGELRVSPCGPAFTLWEALIHIKDSQFPTQVQGWEFSKPELLARAVNNLNAGDPASAKAAVGAEGLARIKDLCRQAGLLHSA